MRRLRAEAGEQHRQRENRRATDNCWRVHGRCSGSEVEVGRVGAASTSERERQPDPGPTARQRAHVEPNGVAVDLDTLPSVARDPALQTADDQAEGPGYDGPH